MNRIFAHTNVLHYTEMFTTNEEDKLRHSEHELFNDYNNLTTIEKCNRKQLNNLHGQALNNAISFAY